MKLYAPKYYEKFKCTADKCSHSCCIGWEIDIDPDTLEKYRALRGGYGQVIADSICPDDTPHFKLGHGDRCPHLDERGLCKIILNVGEDYLCHICREHPRFYNYTAVAEVGIGMSCREAAGIILSSPDYADLYEVGEVEAQADDVEFDGRAERSKIYAILQTPTESYPAKLGQIYREYAIGVGEDDQWLEILASLEYLDEAHRDLFMNYSAACRPVGGEDYLERFLAYFIYRHCTEAYDPEDFRARLGFCLFCERLMASLMCKSTEDVAILASIISEEIEYSVDNTWALTY